MSPTAGKRPEMTPTQWKRVEELLAPALTLPPVARRDFLDRECAGDGMLRSELESLLAAHDRSGPLDRPVGELAEYLTSRVTVRPVGNVVSHYEIQARLGMGGMGVVYRARDLRLGRIVALKFLPAVLSDNAQAKQRFLVEARAAAALEHVNVCTVYEIGETAEGQLFIAMAFVDGESLRDVIERGPLPIDVAIAIARQIADGLECAHQHGIVHRDVKPANVMIGPKGVVKLVDFGIAKLAGSTLTLTGATPGTAAYMSTEQVSGDEVDDRSDVWALGVVLFEMLTGQRPFPGTNEVAVAHAVLTMSTPPVASFRSDVPPGLEAVVERALAKARDDRLPSAAAFRDALRLTSSDAAHVVHTLPAKPEISPAPNAGSSPTPTRPTSSYTARVPRKWIAATALALVAAGGSYVWFRPSTPPPPDMLRVSISAPGVVTPQLSATISPNGRQVAFVAQGESTAAMLWVRSLDELEAKPIRGTERAAHPFWSPDGRSIGFIADNEIKRVDLGGGAVRSLVSGTLRTGAAWGPDGTILFRPRRGELAAIPASGGPVTTVLKADPAKHQQTFAWPRFLPDGRHFIYFDESDRPESEGIYVGSLDSKETRFLVRTDMRAWYAPPGYLVFPRDEALMAQPFDATRLEMHGEPVVIANGVWFARPAAQASFSVSTNGSLAYVNASLWDAELSWFDRGGRPLGTAGPVRHEGVTPQIAPDGRRIAVGRGEFGRESIWIIGAFGENPTRLTFGPMDASHVAVWSADGHRIMYTTGARLIVKDVDRGTERIVLDSAPGVLEDWSRDERYAVFTEVDSHAHLRGVKLDGDRVPFPFAQSSSFNETQPQLSPDGKWMAYTSNESGRDEVYVQAFPTAGQKRQVSINGGAMPRWRRDGKELFYLAGSQFITAVPVVDSTSMAFGRQTPLFRTRLIVEGSESTGLPTKYDVAPDGDRFLFRYPPADPGPPITVVINWTGALRK